MTSVDRSLPEVRDRLYVIGDIHGHYDLFRRLIRLIRQDSDARAPRRTRIILLGNIVDRGPDAAKMIEGCMALTASTDQFVVLKGNHEDMMAEALGGNVAVYSSWLALGGKETLLSWGVDRQVVDGPATVENLAIVTRVVGPQVQAWLASLPLHRRHGNYLFVHAGIRPGVEIEKQQPDDLLWIADEFLRHEESHGIIVVHGHSASQAGIVFRNNRIGVDTDACNTGCLSAVGLEDGTMWTLDTAAAKSPAEAAAAGHVSADRRLGENGARSAAVARGAGR